MRCSDDPQPRAVSETDEKQLQDLMAKAEEENAEKAGDDDNSDEE